MAHKKDARLKCVTKGYQRKVYPLKPHVYSKAEVYRGILKTDIFLILIQNIDCRFLAVLTCTHNVLSINFENLNISFFFQ